MLSALEDVPMIAYPVGSLPSQAVDAQLESAGLRVPKTYSLDTLHAVLSATREGLGTALIPPFLVQDDINSGQLVVLDIPVPVESLAFHAQFRRNARIDVCNALCELMSRLATQAIFNATEACHCERQSRLQVIKVRFGLRNTKPRSCGVGRVSDMPLKVLKHDVCLGDQVCSAGFRPRRDMRSFHRQMRFRFQLAVRAR